MWERGDKHNPIALRQRYYFDHRPILPQDRTWNYRRSYTDIYSLIYFQYLTRDNKKYFLLSNNIPVNEREEFKNFYKGYQRFLSAFPYFSFIGSLFLTGGVVTLYTPKYRLSILGIGLFWYAATQACLRTKFVRPLDEIASYYFVKYRKLAKENILEIEDPRRKHFRLDTSTYYRESEHEIRHHGHGDHGGHHDGYLGPFPVNFFLIFRKLIMKI